jgi:hypothetical protein
MNARALVILGTVVGIVMLMVSSGFAQGTLTWVGNTTSWDAASNWDPGTGGAGWVPLSTNDVVIPSGLTNYPNLTFIDLGAKTCKNIYIQPGAQLRFTNGGNAVLEVNGSWHDEGSLSPGTGTVRLVSSTACTLSTETFYRLENNKYYTTPFGIIAGNAYLAGNISVLNEITFQYEILHCGDFDLIGVGSPNNLLLHNGYLMWGRETFTNSFENVDFDTGTVEFYRVGDQTVPSEYGFHHLILSGGGTKTLDGNVIVTGNIRVQPDTRFDITGCQVDLSRGLYLMGTLTPTQTGGMLIMGDESVLTLNGNGISVADQAVFSAIGTGGVRNRPIVTRPPASSLYYSFHFSGIESMISASYATFEYMDIMGIDLDSAAVIDPDHPMDHCRFQYGDPTSYSSALIHIDNDQEITIPDAEFPVIGAANVYKESDYGRATFMAATGIFAGEAYEVDFYDRVDWVGASPPVAPTVVIERMGGSVRLIWNTVDENTMGDPIVVDNYQVYSDPNPYGSFSNLEVTVVAPDTTWTDTGITDSQSIKFYRVTATEE